MINDWVKKGEIIKGNREEVNLFKTDIREIWKHYLKTHGLDDPDELIGNN
jgi:hypothetical protein